MPRTNLIAKSGYSLGEECLSFEEFLNKYEERHYEWVEGRAIPMAAVHDLHEDLCTWLKSILAFYIRKRQLGRVVGDPYTFKLGIDGSGRSPDIAFIASTNPGQSRGNYFEGAPDLAVEILSPGTERVDKQMKFREYEQAGVTEYWMIDARKKKAEFYVRDAQGRFERVLRRRDGTYHSSIVDGFWINVDWLWQCDTLDLNDTLREIQGFTTI